MAKFTCLLLTGLAVVTVNCTSLGGITNPRNYGPSGNYRNVYAAVYHTHPAPYSRGPPPTYLNSPPVHGRQIYPSQGGYQQYNQPPPRQPHLADPVQSQAIRYQNGQYPTSQPQYQQGRLAPNGGYQQYNQPPRHQPHLAAPVQSQAIRYQNGQYPTSQPQHQQGRLPPNYHAGYSAVSHLGGPAPVDPVLEHALSPLLFPAVISSSHIVEPTHGGPNSPPGFYSQAIHISARPPPPPPREPSLYEYYAQRADAEMMKDKKLNMTSVMVNVKSSNVTDPLQAALARVKEETRRISALSSIQEEDKTTTTNSPGTAKARRKRVRIRTTTTPKPSTTKPAKRQRKRIIRIIRKRVDSNDGTLTKSRVDTNVTPGRQNLKFSTPKQNKSNKRRKLVQRQHRKLTLEDLEPDGESYLEFNPAELITFNEGIDPLAIRLEDNASAQETRKNSGQGQRKNRKKARRRARGQKATTTSAPQEKYKSIERNNQKTEINAQPIRLTPLLIRIGGEDISTNEESRNVRGNRRNGAVQSQKESDNLREIPKVVALNAEEESTTTDFATEFTTFTTEATTESTTSKPTTRTTTTRTTTTEESETETVTEFITETTTERTTENVEQETTEAETETTSESTSEAPVRTTRTLNSTPVRPDETAAQRPVIINYDVSYGREDSSPNSEPTSGIFTGTHQVSATPEPSLAIYGRGHVVVIDPRSLPREVREKLAEGQIPPEIRNSESGQLIRYAFGVHRSYWDEA